MKNILLIVVFVLILVAGISIGAQNSQEITVNYVLATANMPLSTLIALSMIAGFILAAILFLILIAKLSWHNKRLQSKLKSQTKETE